MAFRLTKGEDKRLQSYIERAEIIQASVEDGKSELEEAITRLIDDFNSKHVEPLNDLIGEARGFVEDIHSEREGEYDEMSERWQDGEKGGVAAEWLSAWATGIGELDDVSYAESVRVEFEVPDVQGTLDGLPREIDA